MAMTKMSKVGKIQAGPEFSSFSAFCWSSGRANVVTQGPCGAENHEKGQHFGIWGCAPMWWAGPKTRDGDDENVENGENSDKLDGQVRVTPQLLLFQVLLQFIDLV
jgi:hypothetical protein